MDELSAFVAVLKLCLFAGNLFLSDLLIYSVLGGGVCQSWMALQDAYFQPSYVDIHQESCQGSHQDKADFSTLWPQ